MTKTDDGKSEDRRKTCPFLLKCSLSNRPPYPKGVDFTAQVNEVDGMSVEKRWPGTELLLYTWRDATLRELTDLVQDVYPPAQGRGSRLVYRIVYPNSTGAMTMREVGTVSVLGTSRPSLDETKTLKQLGFQPGDYFAINVASSGGDMRGGGRRDRYEGGRGYGPQGDRGQGSYNNRRQFGQGGRNNRASGRGSWGSTSIGVYNHDDAEMDKDWRREHITDTDDTAKPMWENDESGNRDDDEHARDGADDTETGVAAEAEDGAEKEHEIQPGDGSDSAKNGE
eukprot:202380_1